jgi:hypothetical protein
MNDLQQAQNDILRLQAQLAKLELAGPAAAAAATPAKPSTLGAVFNRLRNGEVSLSQNHYDSAAPSGADDEKQAAYFFTHTFGTTLLVEDAAHALCSIGHANNLLGAADPQWNKVDGWVQWGSTKSIDCPLPNQPHRVGEPSKVVYVGMVARKKSSSIAIAAGLKLGVGIRDNTAGQTKYLEGGPFTLTAAVVGTPGATTSRKYKIVATTDWGETYESNEVTLATAPDNASYSTNVVYVRLDWGAVRGVTIYRIYRLTGAAYVLAGEIFNGVAGFNEQNNFLKTEAGYPAASTTNARAFVEIIFDTLTTDWAVYEVAVPVPSTYNTSATTDKQWARFTLSQALAAGSEQGIEIDKLYASWNYGNWAPAPEDVSAKQGTDTTAASGSQGLVGTGGGGEPPDPGGGGLRLVDPLQN